MPTYRVRTLATAQGQNIQNVMHVATPGESAQGAANDFANAWRTNILPLLHSSYVFQGVELTNIDTEDVSVYSAGTSGLTAGGNAGTPLPTWACVGVRLNTAMRGRAGQGRLGLSPVAEDISAADGNTLTAAAITNFTTPLNAFVADIGASGGTTPMTLMVVSYYKGVDALGKPIKRPTPLSTLVTGFAVSAVIGTRLSRHPNR